MLDQDRSDVDPSLNDRHVSLLNEGAEELSKNGSSDRLIDWVGLVKDHLVLNEHLMRMCVWCMCEGKESYKNLQSED